MMHFPWRWPRWGAGAAVLAYVIAFVASLPGAIVLVRQRDAGRPLRWFRRCPPRSRLAEEGAVHG